jgi:hypothetical protein
MHRRSLLHQKNTDSPGRASGRTAAGFLIAAGSEATTAGLFDRVDKLKWCWLDCRPGHSGQVEVMSDVGGVGKRQAQRRQLAWIRMAERCSATIHPEERQLGTSAVRPHEITVEAWKTC